MAGVVNDIAEKVHSVDVFLVDFLYTQTINDCILIDFL